MTLKIVTVKEQEFKAIEFAEFTVDPDGLLTIGGDNGQGKTSILNGIAWVLGGDSMRPSKPNREGAEFPANIEVTLSNGLVARRSGKNGALSVMASGGLKGNQTTLTTAIHKLALDLPALRARSAKGKVDALLEVIGVGDELKKRTDAVEAAFNARHDAGTLAVAAEKQLEGLERYPDAPDEEVSVAALARKISDAGLMNAAVERDTRLLMGLDNDIRSTEERISDLTRELEALRSNRAERKDELAKLEPIDTTPIQAKLDTAEADNAKVRANEAYKEKSFDATAFRITHGEREKDVAKARAHRQALLDDAEMPIDGLGIKDGELTLNGQKEDCWSGSDALMVWANIAVAQNPECGFAIIGDAAEFDVKTLAEFDTRLKECGLQMLCTRPSTGSEVDLVIKNGRIVGAENA